MERREKNNLPMYSLNEAYRAYSVIACNWLSIHGCLGVDGHGRALMQLLPITLWASGYPEKFQQSQFLNPQTGEFDPQRGKSAIFYLNGHIADGIRILAARFELGKYDAINEVLLDPTIIGHRKTRHAANRHAIKVILNRCRTKY